jgi:mono/diheme cytochrome c family protein
MLGLAFALVASVAYADDAPAAGRVTFYKDVLPVLQENCQVCHREGGANLGGMVAPMAFTTYEGTRPWAKAIGENVSAGKMPPWHADKKFHGVFENERSITPDEANVLIAWAQAGAPRGNPTDAPKLKQWPSTGGWSIGALLRGR